MCNGNAVDYAFGGEFEIGQATPAISYCGDPFVLLANQSDGLEDFWHASIGPVGFVPKANLACVSGFVCIAARPPVVPIKIGIGVQLIAIALLDHVDVFFFNCCAMEASSSQND